jgi:hypothetical protein
LSWGKRIDSIAFGALIVVAALLAAAGVIVRAIDLKNAESLIWGF